MVFAIVLQLCCLAPFCMGAIGILVLEQHAALQSHCASSASLQ
jgi:hypothetical protein